MKPISGEKAGKYMGIPHISLKKKVQRLSYHIMDEIQIIYHYKTTTKS